MPSYTSAYGIRHEFLYHEIELNDKPKEVEGVCYYPIAKYDEEGNKYFIYKMVPTQERLDVITAIKNLTNVNDNDASLIAGIYFRNLAYGDYSELYNRIRVEAKEVTLDRQPVEIVKESVARIKNALYFAQKARKMEVEVNDENLLNLLNNELTVTNKRTVNRINLDTEYPNIMERIKVLNEANKPAVHLETVEPGKVYYESELKKRSKVLVK